MLCGYLKQVCKSITVGELIDILNTCHDKSAVVKMSGMTNFFVHFDQDGKYIDISKSPCANEYGMNKEKHCDKCSRYNTEEKACGCDGKDCMNASMLVDTEKFDELRSRPKETQEVTETREVIEHSEVIDKPVPEKYNLENMSINGVAQQPINITELKDLPANARVLVIPPEEQHMDEEEIQAAVDTALLNALKKMINGIKGDK